LSNLVLTTTKPEIVMYPDRIGNSCDEIEVDDEDMRHKLSTGLYLEIEDFLQMRDMLCFNYKIGLVDEGGVVQLNFTKGVLRRAADEVADICLKKSVGNKEDKNVKFLMCLRDNLPVFSSFL
jgi:hypothetical protein